MSSQLTIPSSTPGGPSSTSASSSQTFNLQNYQDDCDSEYLEALEAVANAEAEDGDDDAYLFHLVEEAERVYPKPVLDAMIQDLKQRGLVHFIQTHVVQGRADVKLLLIALDVCLPRSLMSPEVPDFKLTPILKPALSRILRNRLRLSQYSTPDDVVNLLRTARRIIILSGAGISVSVGIPDFRSKDGIYAQLQREGKYHLDDPTDMFDKRFFQQDPTCFYDFVHSLWPSAFTPSPTHFFIKLLEDRGQLLRNYTQNIDTLEHQAGITRVLPCHGSFATASCTEPGCGYRCRGEDISSAVFQRRVPLCPRCNAPPIDEENDDSKLTDKVNGHAVKLDIENEPNAKPKAPIVPKANKKVVASAKRKKGWGPGESEDDDATDDVWVQGGRAGVGFSDSLTTTGVPGVKKPKSKEAKASSTRPVQRSPSGRLLEMPLQADPSHAPRTWKGVIKPDVIFFGEKLPDDFDKLLLEDRDQVDMLLVMGTSLKVAPVSELVSHIPHSTPVVLINRTPVTHIAMDVQLLGDADEIIGWLCRRLGWELPGSHGGRQNSVGGGVVPPSQPEEKPEKDLNADFEPKRAGDSPIWLWPTAQGGRVVDYLENGAFLDELGRVVVADLDDDHGSDASSDDPADSPQEGNGDASQMNGGHLEDDRRPEMRYLPPGMVNDSQAASSPATSGLYQMSSPAQALVPLPTIGDEDTTVAAEPAPAAAAVDTTLAAPLATTSQPFLTALVPSPKEKQNQEPIERPTAIASLEMRPDSSAAVGAVSGRGLLEPEVGTSFSSARRSREDAIFETADDSGAEGGPIKKRRREDEL